MLFTYNRSLALWDKLGILTREIELYKLLQKKGTEITLLTYGDESDLQFLSLLNNISILPIKGLIESSNRWIKFLKSLFLAFKLKKEINEVEIVKTNQLEGSWVGWLVKILYHKIEYKNHLCLYRYRTL